MEKIIQEMQFKRGTKLVLERRLVPSDLGVLKAGEPAFETDTGQLKIGDGTHSYVDLPYVGISESEQWFAIYDPAQNDVLLYDSQVGKFVNKHLADEKSIIYLSQRGLTIKGYDTARQGQMLVKDSEDGLAWIDPVSDASLQRAVAAAESSMNQAGAYAIQAGNSASDAATSAANANRINQQTMAWVNDKFWWGTIEEYNELESINPGTFYFINAEK